MLVAKTSHRRPGGTLYRYLIREMVFPTLFTLGGLTVVVLTKDMVGYSDLVINRGLTTVQVAWMAFYETVPLISEMLPFAVLVGCLVAFGRLAADREILILEASGISAPRLLGPTLTFAGVMAVLGLFLSLYASPWAHRTLDGDLDRLAMVKPSTAIQAGRINQFGDWRLEAREVSAAGDKLKTVALWMPTIGETVFAKTGDLRPDYEGGNRVTLSDGVVILEPKRGPRMIRFDRLDVALPVGDKTVSRDTEDRIRGETLASLSTALSDDAGADDEKLSKRRARAELHRRFAMPAATLVFGLLVLPLFLSRAHFSRSGGGVMGLLTTLAYYGLLQLGSGLIEGRRISVGLGVWLPNIVIGAIGMLLVTRLTQMTALRRGSDRPVAREKKSARQTDASAIHARRWALQRYVALRFVQMAAICFLVVLVAYVLVDVLERMEWLAKYGATASEVARYYGARIPLLASRVLPMSLLVATALTVSLLAAQGELMGMRACGVPLGRALLPILVISSLMVPTYFVLSNEVLPHTNAVAAYLKHIVIKGRSTETGPRVSAWYRIGDHVYEADHLDPHSGRARDITVYELGPEGFPISRSDAERAWHIGRGVWRLEAPMRTLVSGSTLSQVPASPFAKLGEDVPAEVDTRQLSMSDLRQQIQEVETAGLDATILWVDYWSKLAAPIACLLLPALALFFAVAGPPHPSSAMTLVLSVIASVVYVLLTGVGASLGYGGAISPFVGGFASTLVFAVVTVALGLRLRGSSQAF